MIVKTNFARIFGADAITIFPFIFTALPEDLCLTKHEMVHYKEQMYVLVLPWWLAYLFFSSFRLKAEVRAYKVQIACGGITVQQAAIYLSRNYMLNISAYQAFVYLTE